MKKCFVGKSARSDDTQENTPRATAHRSTGLWARDRCIIMQLRVNRKKMRVNVTRTAFAGWVRKLSAVRLRSILTGFGQFGRFGQFWPVLNAAPGRDNGPLQRAAPRHGKRRPPLRKGRLSSRLLRGVRGHAGDRDRSTLSDDAGCHWTRWETPSGGEEVRRNGYVKTCF